jgi:hypothetical protein
MTDGERRFSNASSAPKSGVSGDDDTVLLGGEQQQVLVLGTLQTKIEGVDCIVTCASKRVGTSRR